MGVPVSAGRCVCGSRPSPELAAGRRPDHLYQWRVIEGLKPLRGEPDLVLFGGPVATVDRGFRVTDAVAIKDGHIMAVGESAEVRALAGRHTEAVDLHGCMALPGFIDSHCHPTQVGLRRLKLDLMDCRSIAEILERVSARAAQSPPGQWVEG